jgi:hypothetical protein
MWINKIILFPFLFSLFCGFKQPLYCKLSDKIYFSYNKEICNKNGLHLVGKGGAMMDDVQQVNAHYVSYDRLTVEEARRLYVDVAEGYLSRYNQNEEIRPYLHNYPFTINNFKIMIGFENENHQHMDKGFVAVVSNIESKGIIYYSSYNHETKAFIDLHEEPYETAREIVMRESHPL